MKRKNSEAAKADEKNDVILADAGGKFGKKSKI